MIPELKCGIVLRTLGWNTPRNRPPAPEKRLAGRPSHPIQGSQGHQTSATCITCQLGLAHLSTYTLECIINCTSKADVKITCPRNYQLIYAYIYIDIHTHKPNWDIEAIWMSFFTALSRIRSPWGGEGPGTLERWIILDVFFAKLEHLLSFKLGSYAVPDFEILCLCTSL